MYRNTQKYLNIVWRIERNVFSFLPVCVDAMAVTEKLLIHLKFGPDGYAKLAVQFLV